jgi:beta-galactosidase/beta-glucuronidase
MVISVFVFTSNLRHRCYWSTPIAVNPRASRESTVLSKTAQIRFLTCFLVCTALFTVQTCWGQSITLNQWEVSIDQGKTFHSVAAARAIEDCIDAGFDGVSIYRTTLSSIDLAADQRVILHFSAVATHAKVIINGQFVAEHLGGWTPFSVEISQYLREAARPELQVIVDERVGHNTQGFLPVITNHFGGIWQPVTLEVTGAATIVKDWSSAAVDHANLGSDPQVNVRVPVSHSAGAADIELRLFIAELPLRAETLDLDSLTWKRAEATFAAQPLVDHLTLRAEAGNGVSNFTATFKPPSQLAAWSIDSPQLYLLKVELWLANKRCDIQHIQFARREFQVEQDKFVLNDQPISIRGVLNWGYSPPSIAPSLDRQWMKREIIFAQERGFNLMKFCLWIPPKSYLELCDRMGMLAWIEYPTWHPKLDQSHLKELRQEYKEFFAFDRNHPSVVLRSLTCETGPAADLQVIRSLYDQCKQMIPGAIVVDDSSWISWNRVHDFYDDHPYGNNHTWVATLAKLRNYISQREQQPLVLGEAIAADSWLDPAEDLLKQAASDQAHGSWSVAECSVD